MHITMRFVPHWVARYCKPPYCLFGSKPQCLASFYNLIYVTENEETHHSCLPGINEWANRKLQLHTTHWIVPLHVRVQKGLISIFPSIHAPLQHTPAKGDRFVSLNFIVSREPPLAPNVDRLTVPRIQN